MGIPREQIYSSGFKSCHPLVFRAALDQLAIENRIAMDGDSLRLPGRTVVLQEAESTAKTQIEQAFQQAGWRVPSVDEVLATVAVPKEQSRKLVTLLIREKQLVRVSEQLTFHSESIQRLKERLSDYKKESSQIDVGKFKELTGISRKYAIPLLEFLDKQQVTRRVGDHRVIL